MSDTLEARRQAIWDTIDRRLKEEYWAAGANVPDDGEEMSRLADEIVALLRLDTMHDMQRARFKTLNKELDAHSEAFSVAVKVHLEALKACWDSVGGEPE